MTQQLYQTINNRLTSQADPVQAAQLMRFFRTGVGEYGEGDRFLGLKVPQTRAIVAEFCHKATLYDVEHLTASPWHEVRLSGFLLLIEIYKTAKRRRDDVKPIIDYYLSIIVRGNNWDLVDLIAPKILGDYLVSNPSERHILHTLTAMNGHLWHQRVGIVACWTLIKYGFFDDILTIAAKLLTHRHDLIHKACGWMLREVGKRGGLDKLLTFLDQYAATMPRTMLRYAIEKLSIEQRGYYMNLN